MKPNHRTALALRPGLHTPNQIIEYAKAVDEFGTFSHVFIPDIPGGLESIEISTAALSQTKNLKIGSGIIRILEHNNMILRRRIETIQSLSDFRFVLGVGAGKVGPNRHDTISKMLLQLDELRASFGGTSGLASRAPETYIASLKPGIAMRAAGHCEGLLLNFCSPEYAKSMVEKVSVRAKPTFACYLKIFYSESQIAASRLLVEEFAKYDSIDSYHDMFVHDGIASTISESRKNLEIGNPKIPESLLKISLVNPTSDELKKYVMGFRDSGIDLPCVYPYFIQDESNDYKLSVIKRIAESL